MYPGVLLYIACRSQDDVIKQISNLLQIPNRIVTVNDAYFNWSRKLNLQYVELYIGYLLVTGFLFYASSCSR